MDHLIRPREHRRWDRQAEGLRGLQIDDELELRRLLDGQIGRFRALEDLVDKVGGPPPQLEDVLDRRTSDRLFGECPELVDRG